MSNSVVTDSEEIRESFGKYELIEKIGAGGMAEIFKARLTGIAGFEKVLVVKRILPSYAENKAFITMLVDEANVCSALQHPNIVQVYELGEVNERPYIAMEYVHGSDLLKVLSRCTRVGRRIPTELCLLVISEVCKGLEYAHKATDVRGNMLHIIHRDVSPSNVIISFDGDVKIMDFGVARAAPGKGPRTRAGVLKGKLGYMCPEQVLGDEFDHRADLFSLGIVLYEMLTLKRLFVGKTDLETMLNIRDVRIDARLRRHDYLPAPVVSILRKALTRRPEDRFQTAMEFHDAIIDYLFDERLRVEGVQLARLLGELFPEALGAVVSQPTTSVTDDMILDEASIGGVVVGNAADGATQPDLSTSLSFEQAAAGGAEQEVGEQEQASTRPARPDSLEAGASDADVSAEEGDSRQPEKETGDEMSPQDTTVDASGQESAWDDTQLAEASFELHNPDGDVFGPIGYENLLNMLHNGSVCAEESLRINGEGWVRVADVPSLAQIAQALRGPITEGPVFEGDVSQLTTPRTIYRISRQRMTGLLRLKRQSRVKDLYFKAGRPRHIASNLRGELFGSFLVQQGILSAARRDEAVEHARESGSKLGDALVMIGDLAPSELYRLLARHFEEKFLEIFSWQLGSYAFYHGVQPAADVIPLELDPLAAVTDGVRRYFDQGLLDPFFAGRLDSHYVEIPTDKGGPSQLHFNSKETRHCSHLRRSKTMRQLLTKIGRSDEDRLTLYRVMFILHEVELIGFEL